MARRVEVDVCRRFVLEDVRVEKPELLLLSESPEHGSVDPCLVKCAAANPVRERLQESVAGRQLDVDAGLEGQGGGLTAVGGDGVHDFKECHGEIVGDDNAVEAEFLPQHSGEVIGIRGHRHAVDVGVGIHHRPRAPVEDRHLERWEKDVRDLPRPRADGRVIASGPGRGVAEEMLERRMHSRGLEPANIGGADGTDEVRVLPDAFVDAPPAGIANDIEHRGEALVDAELLHRVADRPRHLLDERRIE